MASRSRIASRSGSGPASGWYSSSGAKSVCTPSRPPASRTWLTCSRSSDTARPPLSASRAIACNATRKLSIWSAICWVKSSKSLAGSFSSDAAGTEFWLLIYCSSPFESSSQGHLVGILEVTAYRQSTSKSRHAQPHRFEQPREIGRGGLPLEVRVRRQDDFGDHPIGQACHQLADAQVVRADPLDRRDRATEHVVAATELAGAFDRDDVLGLLHDTDHRKVPPRVTTDPALLILRHVAQTEQNFTRSFTSARTWASRRMSAGSVAKMWNAMRCALLGPTPGSRPNSSIRSWTTPSYTGALFFYSRMRGHGSVSYTH